MPPGSMNLQHSTNKNISFQTIWQQFAVNKICLFWPTKYFKWLENTHSINQETYQPHLMRNKAWVS